MQDAKIHRLGVDFRRTTLEVHGPLFGEMRPLGHDGEKHPLEAYLGAGGAPLWTNLMFGYQT
jgi:hypothetical protein